ncbi:MAG: thioredoxin family protein [Paracoccaceae bacterium]|nr:thioredoxin family protein [Paracoccaceae bacterium]
MRILFAALAIAILPLLAMPAIAQENGGLYTEDWFAVTFKDMREDLETAQSEGKRLALIVEQYGCIYCRKLHEEVLSDPEVADFIKANFLVVQYNMFGDEEVTDFDGEVLTEEEAVRRWGVIFTPTIIFLADEVSGDVVKASEAAVQTMPGAFGKWTTLNMFRWVYKKGYEGEEHFQKYHARIIEELRAEGRL